MESLGLRQDDEDEEITFAIWNNADLEKRTTKLSTFLRELGQWTLKANVHLRIKDIQRTEIREEKARAKSNP